MVGLFVCFEFFGELEFVNYIVDNDELIFNILMIDLELCDVMIELFDNVIEV